MLKALVVEDEFLVRDLVVEELTSTGVEVTEASSGEEALRILADGLAFDILITDIRLGGDVDGWQVAEAVRAVSPTMPVIYVSGFSQTQRPVPGSVFHAKPFRLCAIVADVLKLTAASGARVEAEVPGSRNAGQASASAEDEALR